MSLNLFSPTVSPEKFHPAFRKLFTQANEFDKNLLAQWAEGFLDRDRKFVKEFQTSFNSSFWELYLHAAFKELGFSCDFGHSRPDFCITSPLSFVVEATISSNAQGQPAVTDTNLKELPQDYNEFNRQAIIRLSNSLHVKYRKFVDSYSHLSHVKDKPYIIAVAPFDRPHFQFQAQRPVEALLYRAYVDEETYLARHPDRDVPLLPQDMPFVLMDSGERLPMGLFCDDSMSEISAIIQSTAATWSKVRAMGGDPDVIITAIYENRVDGGIEVFSGKNEQYAEDILDGLRVYHNPFARYPLDPSLFERPEIFQATSLGPVKLRMLSDSRRNLVNRSAMSFPRGTIEEVWKALRPVPEMDQSQ